MPFFPKPTTKTKDGHAIAFPDVCKTPAGAPSPTPIPYPNTHVASMKRAISKVKITGKKLLEKGSTFSKSQGNEAGSGLKSAGIASSKAMAKAAYKVEVLMTGHVKVMGLAPKLDHKKAVALQKKFESGLEKELKALLEASKDDRDQKREVERLVSDVTRAVRGY